MVFCFLSLTTYSTRKTDPEELIFYPSIHRIMNRAGIHEYDITNGFEEDSKGSRVRVHSITFTALNKTHTVEARKVDVLARRIKARIDSLID